MYRPKGYNCNLMINVLSFRSFGFIAMLVVMAMLTMISFGVLVDYASAHEPPTHEFCSETSGVHFPSNDKPDDAKAPDYCAPPSCPGTTLNPEIYHCNQSDLDKAGTDIQETIQTVLNIFSWIVGIASVIMIIYAGFKYVISQGGEGTAQARNTILYAVVGLVVVALAQAIVRFVIGRV